MKKALAQQILFLILIVAAVAVWRARYTLFPATKLAAQKYVSGNVTNTSQDSVETPLVVKNFLTTLKFESEKYQYRFGAKDPRQPDSLGYLDGPGAIVWAFQLTGLITPKQYPFHSNLVLDKENFQKCDGDMRPGDLLLLASHGNALHWIAIAAMKPSFDWQNYTEQRWFEATELLLEMTPTGFVEHVPGSPIYSEEFSRSACLRHKKFADEWERLEGSKSMPAASKMELHDAIASAAEIEGQSRPWLALEKSALIDASGAMSQRNSTCIIGYMAKCTHPLSNEAELTFSGLLGKTAHVLVSISKEEGTQDFVREGNIQNGAFRFRIPLGAPGRFTVTLFLDNSASPVATYVVHTLEIAPTSL